jgi:hypothetical protein
MHLNHLQYLPIAPVFFRLLFDLFAALVLFVQLVILQYADTRLGVRRGAAAVRLVAGQLRQYPDRPVSRAERDGRSRRRALRQADRSTI